jgi:KUP system potassium uptake protein
MSKPITKKKLSYLMAGAIGVVFGDIGTSPLYALKSCFSIIHLPVSEPNILGIISLFIWALVLVVSFKYVRLVLKMDHHGEGGILALSTLVASNNKYRSVSIILGLIGAALFFGDGIITPAISVLSAVEGISLITPHLHYYLIPITIVVLTILFSVQKFGTGRLGQFFGPIMITWFLVLFLLGVYQIYKCPSVLKALSPHYGLNFLLHHSWRGLSVMGGVILVVTGAEALYADLGHFGRAPIQLSWIFFVFPALVVNYLGQGALLLLSPEAISHPFYVMAPAWALQPLVLLATCATIIASQSILSGLFSIAHHSIMLNYLPRLKVENTSESQIGQIYIPTVNYLIYILTIAAVFQFGSSEKLAAAYGLCVAGIMLITTILIFIMALDKLRWNKIKIGCVFMPIFFLDLLFVSTNIMKFFEGAWYVIILTGMAYYAMHIWRKGTKALEKQKIIIHMPVQKYIEKHLETYPHRVPGTALFLCKEPFKIPSTLAVNLRHNKYLHEKIIFVSFISTEIPYQKMAERVSYHTIAHNVSQIIVHSGFKEIPNLNKVFNWLKEEKIIEMNEDISVFLGKGIPMRSKSPVLSGFSESLYIYLSSITQNATDFYRVPHHKVIELGVRYKI